MSRGSSGEGRPLTPEFPGPSAPATLNCSATCRGETEGTELREAVHKLMGSVAQRILLDAHCPVLAVKAD